MNHFSTKISIPLIPPHLVSRQHLIGTLDQIFKKKLTVISAHAGSGKTTLLCEWIAVRGFEPRVAWFSLGDQDNNPRQFWKYYIAALSTVIKEDFSDWFRWSEQPSPDDLDDLINRINIGVKVDFVFILDDYHLITVEAIHKALIYFLDYLPPRMHVVISGRSQPPIPIAQMRVRNQLLEITRDNLNFSRDEGRLLIKKMTGQELSIDAIAELNAKTEGWVAGLQMAALSLKTYQHEDIDGFIKGFTGSHHFVMDYLAEQAFNKQMMSIREFLLTTSILDEMCGSLCDAVTGGFDGDSILEWLERNNLFVVCLDESRQWYRYHHLFADFLYKKLHQEHPNQVTKLHQRAAHWYEEQFGSCESAVKHALEAKDFQYADQLIQRVETSMWGMDRIADLGYWFKAMPEDYVNIRPDLCLSLAWGAVLGGNLEELQPYLVRIEEYCLHNPDNSRELLSPDGWRFTHDYFLAHVEILRGVDAICRKLDVEEALPFLQRAIERTPKEKNCRERALALAYLAFYHFLHENLDEANRLTIETAEISWNCGHYALHNSSISNLADIDILSGRLIKAEALLRQNIQSLRDHEVPVLTGSEQAGLSTIYRQWNKLDLSQEMSDEALRLAEAGGNSFGLIDVYQGRAWLQMAKDNLRDAEIFIRKAYQISKRGALRYHTEINRIVQVRLWLLQKNLAGASYWAEQCQSTLQDMPPYLKEFQELTIARIWMGEKRAGKALSLLKNLLTSAESGGRIGIIIEVLVLMALASNELRLSNQTNEYLARALSLARPEKYVRIFIDEGEAMEELLRKAHQHDVPPFAEVAMRSYLHLLLHSFEKKAPKPISFPRADRAIQPLIEPLSERELQVMRLIANGMSYEEVAQELVVALSTIQWHIKNIYQKLNVHSGIEAVAISRQLNLL
jgi:LuxR family maltose regulon positive regulatory protein